jgi:hypothetical protein
MAALLRGLDERSAARLKYAHRKAARDRRMERLKVRQDSLQTGVMPSG